MDAFPESRNNDVLAGRIDSTGYFFYYILEKKHRNKNMEIKTHRNYDAFAGRSNGRRKFQRTEKITGTWEDSASHQMLVVIKCIFSCINFCLCSYHLKHAVCQNVFTLKTTSSCLLLKTNDDSKML